MKRRHASAFQTLCFLLGILILGMFCVAVSTRSEMVSHPCSRPDTQSHITYSSRDSHHGVFMTPGFGEDKPYPANTFCEFRFRAQPGQVVRIKWHAFHLEQPMIRNNQCLHDYVEIKITDYQNNQHISGRYCGKKEPPDLNTMQATVDIVFQSSYTKHFQGFKGDYIFMDEKDVPTPSSIIPSNLPDRLKKQCGGKAVGEHSGTIISPGYPDSYPENVECNWAVRVERGKQIYIKLLDLELSESMECNTVALYIIDGYKHEVLMSSSIKAQSRGDRSTQVHFCGEGKYYLDEGSKSYMSDRNRLIVRFVTTQGPDASMKRNRQKLGNPIGFRLVWTEVTLEDNEEDCDQFQCRGGEYCIDEGKKICAARKRYCIHKSLVCNGLPNCAESDESDEEDCYSAQIIGAGASLFAFLVLIIVVVIVFQKRRNRKQLFRLRMQRRQASSTAASVDHNLPVAGQVSGELSTQQSHEPLIQLTALPQNYYGYAQAANDDDDVGRPFLVSNHVPTTQVHQQQAPNPRRGPTLSVTRLPPVSFEENSFSGNDSAEEIWETRPGMRALPLGLRVRNTALVPQSSTESDRSVPVEVHRQGSCDSPGMDICMSEQTLRLSGSAMRQTPPPVPPKPMRRPVFVPPPTYQEAFDSDHSNDSAQGHNPKRKSVGFVEPDRAVAIPETVDEERSCSPWHQLKPAMV